MSETIIKPGDKVNFLHSRVSGRTTHLSTKNAVVLEVDEVNAVVKLSNNHKKTIPLKRLRLKSEGSDLNDFWNALEKGVAEKTAPKKEVK